MYAYRRLQRRNLLKNAHRGNDYVLFSSTRTAPTILISLDIRLCLSLAHDNPVISQTTHSCTCGGRGSGDIMLPVSETRRRVACLHSTVWTRLNAFIKCV